MPARSRPGRRPLILAFHGGTGTGTAMRRLAALDLRADREGWVVAYPDAIGGHWNDGRRAPAIASHRNDVDDIAFAAALVDHLVATAGVDPDRVYATGMSNGGMLCHRLAAERPDLVAAIAPVAGLAPEPLVAAGPPRRPVPVLVVHGTADPVVPWVGGPVSGPRLGSLNPVWRADRVGNPPDLGTGPEGGDADRGRVASVEETVAWWRRAAGHDGDDLGHGEDEGDRGPIVQALPHRDPADPTRVRVTSWSGGTAGADVVLVAVEGGGHTWPGGLQYLPQRLIGVTAGDLNASDTMVAFFAGRTRRG
ncbi:MAG: PHB depolymerase family esterase [Acidimicrobiales bacterium]